jgi:hypothetical protein
LLAFGERKSLASEHVILVPGPAEEVAAVRRIFREFADELRNVDSIAERLNRDGVRYHRGASWKPDSLRIILQDSRYIGMQVWGRTSSFLSSPVQPLPLSKWVVYPNACEPIISRELYLRAQQVFANFTHRLRDEQLLERVRLLYKWHGKLSGRVIDNSRLCPGLSTYYARFGSLLNLYDRLGYPAQKLRTYANLRLTGMRLRRNLINSILNAFPNQLQEVRKNRRFRPRLRYRKTGLLVSVVFARRCEGSSGSWIIEAPRSERKHTTLLALLNIQVGTIGQLRVFPEIPLKNRHRRVRVPDDWLETGVRLERISDFLEVIKAVRLRSSGN